MKSSRVPSAQNSPRQRDPELCFKAADPPAHHPIDVALPVQIALLQNGDQMVKRSTLLANAGRRMSPAKRGFALTPDLPIGRSDPFIDSASL